MCYSYRNLQSDIITCAYDLPVSNKLIHQSKPRLQFTDTRDSIYVMYIWKRQFICVRVCVSVGVGVFQSNKPEGKRPFGRQRLRQESAIKVVKRNRV